MADHVLDRLRSAESFRGLGISGGALLGQGAGFVLGIPGFQDGHLLRRDRSPTLSPSMPAGPEPIHEPGVSPRSV
jgi:hypothetical protein